jgi:hypothetical protein
MAVDEVTLFSNTQTSPCDWRGYALLPTTRPPADWSECVSAKTLYADGYSLAAYALDKRGAVWRWEYIDSAYYLIGDLILWPLWGCGAGLVVGLALAFTGVMGKRRLVRGKGAADINAA